MEGFLRMLRMSALPSDASRALLREPMQIFQILPSKSKTRRITTTMPKPLLG